MKKANKANLIRATLDDIYTTWGDIFFRMKNAIIFQKFI